MNNTHNIARSTFINFLGLIIPVMVILITVPLYLKWIGEERYGVLLLAISLLGYFVAFDFGLGKAVAKRLAGIKEPEAATEVFWTAFYISAVIGIGGAFLLYLVGGWLVSIIKIPDDIYQETLDSIPWLAAIVPLVSIASVLTGALQARHAFIALNICQTLGVIGLQVFPLISAMLGYQSMSNLIAAALLGRFVGVLPMFWANAYILPFSGKPAIKRSEAAPLLKFGGWVSGSSAIIPLLTIVDRLVIGSKLGAAAITAYTIPFNLTQRLNYLPLSLSMTLFPRFSEIEGEQSLSLLRQAILALTALQTPMIILAIVLMQPFLDIWIGNELAAKAGPVAIILLLSIWFNGPAFVPATYLPAQGRPDLMTKFYLAELVPFITILWLMVGWFGIIGAAVTWTLRSVADAIFSFVMTGTLGSFWRALLPSAPMVILAVATVYVPLDFTYRATLQFIIFFISLLISYLSLPPEIRNKLLFWKKNRFQSLPQD